MASAVFAGTSLVNMFVRDCWVNGIRRLVVGPRAEDEDFFEIRTEWSDRTVLYLHRSYSDLFRLSRKLEECFPEEHEETELSEGLMKIRESHDIEEKLNLVERLLKNIINLKISRSEVMLTFFERSPLDQVLRNDEVHRIQPCFQSHMTISEVKRSNGFCLANTETIVFDQNLLEEKQRTSPTASHRYDDAPELLSDTELSREDPLAYVTNLSYYHLVPFETDILE